MAKRKKSPTSKKSRTLAKEVENDLAALERAHAGAYDRDVTPLEMAHILRIQKRVQAEMRLEKRT